MAGEILFMGGLFNITDPIFHWQLYIWGWVAACIFAVVFHVGYRYGPWKGYEALWGLYYAFKAGSNAAFISGLQLYYVMKSEAQAKCVFDYGSWDYGDLLKSRKSRLPGKLRRIFFYYPTEFLDNIDWAHALVYKYGHKNMDVEIAKKLQNEEWEEAPSTTIGGIRTDIILDGDLWVPRDTPQHAAVEAACLEWNEANPGDQVHSYSKFQRLMEEGRMKVPEGVKTEVVIPWPRVDGSFPVFREDNETAGARREAAEELTQEEANALRRFYLPMLLGEFAFSFILLLFRFLSLR